jgi:hypothetical protein
MSIEADSFLCLQLDRARSTRAGTEKKKSHTGVRTSKKGRVATYMEELYQFICK